MNYLVEQLINGLSLGCIYAFIALGYTMVYGIIKLINFAHGEFFMLGSFAGYFLLMYGGVETWGLPHPLPVVLSVTLALFVAGFSSALLAVVTERLAYRPLQKASRIAALLTALGVSLLFQNLAMQGFSAEQKGYPEARRFVSFEEAQGLGGSRFEEPAYVIFERESLLDSKLVEDRTRVLPAQQPLDAAKVREEYGALKHHGAPIRGFYVDAPIAVGAKKGLIIASLLVSFGLLWLLVHKTSYGRAMRAVSYNPEAAQLMGIASGRVIAVTFFVGAFLAGFGGVIWGIRYGKVEPFMGSLAGLKAFIAAVIGGIGSLPGAILGGILLGVLEVMIPAYLPSEYSGYKDAMAFVALIVILLVKPSGLLGRWEGQKV